MSREIKFRIWSVDQKTYDYKFPYNSIGDFYVNTRGKVFSDFGNTVAPEVRQEAFVVEQYTGLKDKNGKEIYEGDVVYDIYTGDEVFIVGWDKDKASFMLADTADYPMAYFDEYELDKDLEVIGNIHENPELLGGEE